MRQAYATHSEEDLRPGVYIVRSEAVSDEVLEEATPHRREPARAALMLAIARINAWSRLNVPMRQLGGGWA